MDGFDRADWLDGRNWIRLNWPHRYNRFYGPNRSNRLVRSYRPYWVYGLDRPCRNCGKYRGNGSHGPNGDGSYWACWYCGKYGGHWRYWCNRPYWRTGRSRRSWRSRS